MKRIMNIVNTINLLAVIMSVFNLMVLMYVVIFEFVSAEHFFWLQMLPIKYIRFVGQSSLVNLVYSFVISVFKLCNDTYKKSVKFPVVLNVLSLCIFIIYMIHVVNVM